MAAISISTPHVGHPPVDPMRIFEKRYSKAHYFLEFRDRPDEVNALFASDPDAFFRQMFRTTPPGTILSPALTHLPTRFAEFLEAGAPHVTGSVVTDAQRAVYTEAYSRTGFLPGMNYYRNTTPNWEFAKGLDTTIRVPSLMISPADDVFLPPGTTDAMVNTVPELTRVTVPNCGHWAMWDAPEAINREIIGWLDGRSLR